MNVFNNNGRSVSIGDGKLVVDGKSIPFDSSQGINMSTINGVTLINGKPLDFYLNGSGESVLPEDRYELIPENGLFRLKSKQRLLLHDVGIGSLGGLVSGPEVLSQHGQSWIDFQSKVVGTSKVTGNAIITGDSVLTNTNVSGESIIINANISDSSMSGCSKIFKSDIKSCQLSGLVKVTGSQIENCQFSGQVEVESSQLNNIQASGITCYQYSKKRKVMV